MAEMVLGGWTRFAPLSDEEQKLFAEATAGLKGVDYQPLVVSHQVTSGTNYKFFCNSRIIYPGATNEAAMIHVYVNPAGTIAVTAINRMAD